MKHVAPAQLRTVPLYCYIHDGLTGRVIGSQQASVNGNWEWIVQRVAEWFDCSPDDVGCLDTEDRLDNITVAGEIVGYTDLN